MDDRASEVASPAVALSEETFGAIDPADRIVSAPAARDPTLANALVIVAMLGMSVVSFDTSGGSAARSDEAEPEIISVELVTDPLKRPTSDIPIIGDDRPVAPEAPPTPPPDEKPPEPEPPKPERVEQTPPAEPQAEPTRPPAPLPPAETIAEGLDPAAEEPLKPDPLSEFEKKRNEVMAELARRQETVTPPPTPVPTGAGPSSNGAGATKEASAYAKSVIAALVRTKPRVGNRRGDAVVSFEVGLDGGLKFLKLMKSSGDATLDAAALAAVRRAKFAAPPAGIASTELTYTITYFSE